MTRRSWGLRALFRDFVWKNRQNLKFKKKIVSKNLNNFFQNDRLWLKIGSDLDYNEFKKF